MRVIAGTARGLRLAAPKDPRTRPISDKVKESLFGAIGERVLGARVLDLYAGSGAIGIEALSRGAASATFVERARPAVAVIRENLARTGLGEAAVIHAQAVEAFLAATAEPPWDLALLDPPYAERTLDLPLERLRPHLASGALVVVKHFWRTPMPAAAGLAITRSRRFGETALTFLEEER
ncbi:MAG TPA: 16S rRNA (guanine(966)-N(2))-methyltransferase RsmD [Candidatus Limnocylindria bacterium]|nr:16S rRNA (guanine(966)-N(2))-methyltransferase RsmD [Candidatus Limnocylindria bacterium]